VLITVVVFALIVTIILSGLFILRTRDRQDRQSAHLVFLIWFESLIPAVLITIAVSTLLLITTVIGK
jgi:hypothetical protein